MAIACGGYLQHQLQGQTTQFARDLALDDLTAQLGGIPAHKIVYAWLALKALKDALA